MTTPPNLPTVMRAMVRARAAEDVDAVKAAVAPVGLTVMTKDNGAQCSQSRWSAYVYQDAVFKRHGVGTSELHAAKLVAYNVLICMRDIAIDNIEREVTE